MTEKQKALRDLAGLHPMTEDERDAQRVSFVYGNLALDREGVTKAEVGRALQNLKAAGTGGSESE